MDDASDDDLWDQDANSEPDASVTPELFVAWRSPRYGRANPERMNNPVWEWLIRSRATAYSANKKFNGPSSFDAGPCWCFSRFGQSKTKLPDGRIVMVGGEHEDFYDPDFFIYNDVVVKNPDATIEIYGYPRELFPPTDFHSGTLVGNEIVLIGALGYHNERIPGLAQIYVLDVAKFSISSRNASGSSPGWLHNHNVTLLPEENAILVTGGLVEIGDPDRPLPENIDDWKLHLADWRWERLTKRQWKRWNVRRKDEKMNDLFSIRSAAYWKGLIDKGWRPIQGSGIELMTELEKEKEKLKESLGFMPDLELVAVLYEPPVAHTKIPRNEDKDDEYNVYRIDVNGVTVRYVEGSFSIQLTIEGDFPTSTADLLVADLVEKLSALERVPYESIRL